MACSYNFAYEYTIDPSFSGTESFVLAPAAHTTQVLADFVGCGYNPGAMKTALVHDWLNQIGGAENVLETLVDMFPGAPLYTSIYAPKLMPASYAAWDIRTSFMQRLPGVASHHQSYLPLYPLAFEQFDLGGYDLVLSNKSAFCHGVITPPETLHISYCLTPTRFLWMYESYRQREGLGKAADAALRPALATIPESLILSIGTPYARRGILYDSYKQNFGHEGRSFIWKAPSAVMNPTLDQDIIKAALAEDPQAAGAEWLCEWRADIESFLAFESLQACVVPDRFELPPVGRVEYTAFIDPSFGGQDSFTLAIAHSEMEGRVKILDTVRERKPGFKPDEVVAEFAQIMLAYRCLEVTSDRFSREWVRNAFEARGIRVKFSDRSSSELYLDLLPLVTSRAVELLDNRALIGQLANLDRRVRSGGRDLVVHFPGRHDDVAVAAAGALTLAGAQRGATVTAYQGIYDAEKKRWY